MKYNDINTPIKVRRIKLTTEQKLNKRGLPSFRQHVDYLKFVMSK